MIPASAAVVVTAPDILDDVEYTAIREDFKDIREALKVKVSGTLTPHFFTDWGAMYARFQENQFLLKPFRDRVSTWTPFHEDAQKVKKLFEEFFALFKDQETDHHEAAIAKSVKLMAFIEAHEGMQAKRDEGDEETEMQERRKIELALEIDEKSNMRFVQANQFPETQLEQEMEVYRTIPIPPEESVHFSGLKNLISPDWISNKKFSTTLLNQDHSQLELALAYPYTHPLLNSIQSTCLDLLFYLEQVKDHSEHPILTRPIELGLAYLQNIILRYEVLEMTQGQTQILQQSAEAPLKMEELFATSIPEDETLPLYELQELILLIWFPKDSSYKKALFPHKNPRFAELQNTLNTDYKHPFSKAIKQACQAVIAVLEKGSLDPNAKPPEEAYYRNMKLVRHLISGEMWNRAFP